MLAFDSLNGLLDRLDGLCYADFCRAMFVVWWNM